LLQLVSKKVAMAQALHSDGINFIAESCKPLRRGDDRVESESIYER
jgi:hypothetical protein